jgi:hypothetical protein
MLQWLYIYVASVCPQCFICLFQTYVASVFIWMLHMFHTYVASVLSRCLRIFAMVINCFFKCFRCIFRVFHLSFLYVASVASGCFKSRSGVAHGMHMKAGGARAVLVERRSGNVGPYVGASDAGMVERSPATRAHVWMRKTEGKPTATVGVRT